MRPTCTLLLDSFLMGRGWVRADSHKTSPAAIRPSCHANSALNMVETVNNERRLRPQEHFLQVVLAPAQLMESWQWRARSSEIGRYCLDKYCVRAQIQDRKLSLNLFDDSWAMGRPNVEHRSPEVVILNSSPDPSPNSMVLSMRQAASIQGSMFNCQKKITPDPARSSRAGYGRAP